MRQLTFVALLVVFNCTVRADSLLPVSSRAALGGNDLIGWSQLGGNGTSKPNPFTATSNGGLVATVSQASLNTIVIVQNVGWDGNFASHDTMIWTNGGGPVTIQFASPVSAAGAQIEPDYNLTGYGPFTATLSAYSTTGQLLGMTTAVGDSQFTSDNSALFIGLRDLSGADIGSVVFNTTAPNPAGNFALNEVSIDTTGINAAPLPSCAWGCATLLGGLGLVTILRRSRRVDWAQY